MKNVIILFALFLICEARSQNFEFTDHLIERQSSNFYRFNSIDFDGDGDIDFLPSFLLIEDNRNELKWYENIDGKFEVRHIDGFADNVLVEFSNLNNTGLYDIYNIDQSENEINIHHQLSPGIFEKELFFRFPENEGSFYYEITDFNNDLQADIVTLGFNGNIISTYVYINNGGVFTQIDLGVDIDFFIASHQLYREIYIEDMNNDGFKDIVYINREKETLSSPLKDYIIYLKNNGNNSFTKSRIGDLNNLVENNVNNTNLQNILTIKDSNNNGLMDIFFPVQVGAPNWGIGFILQETEDVFNQSTLNAIIPFQSGPSKILFINQDDDQDLDILTVPYTVGKFFYYENLGGVSYSIEPLLVDMQNSIENSILVDLDNDNLLDIVTSEDGTLHQYKQISELVFEKQPMSNEFVGGIKLVKNIEFDGDKHKELVVVSDDNSSLFLYLNSNSENFERILLDGTEFNILGIGIEDYNDDGFEDILMASELFANGTLQLFWYENIKGVSFVKHFLASISDRVFYSTKIQFIDLDNDGDLDLYTKNESKISWYENINNVYQLQQIIFHFSDISRSSLIDFDKDGDLDIVETSRFCVFITCNYSTHWWELVNNEYISHLLEADTRYSVFMPIDINNDGLVDIFARKTNGDQFIWKGSGNDFSVIPFDDFSFRSDMELKDLNNDGLVDILMGGSIYYNQGDFQFHRTEFFDLTQINNGEGFGVKYIADINSDGLLDMITQKKIGGDFLSRNAREIGLFKQISRSPVQIPAINMLLLFLLFTLIVMISKRALNQD